MPCSESSRSGGTAGAGTAARRGRIVGGVGRKFFTTLCTGGLTALAAAGFSHAAPGDTLGKTTAKQRIVPAGGSGFRLLKPARGERYVVRGGPGRRGRALGRPRRARAKRRRSISYFGQLTDFQLADEESPARLEYLDAAPKPFISGWRPHEAFTPFEADRMVRQFNYFARRPPHRTGRRGRPKMDFVINTGDLADNSQLNEVRWSVKLMEGGTVSPGSGVDPGRFFGRHPLCPPELAPGLGLTDPLRYAGVQSRTLWPAPTMGYFWDPDEPDPSPVPANPRFFNPNSEAPRWPGLMDRAQQPFRASGLRVPGYVAFGNHDRLFQGNVYARRVLNQLATGCLKPINDSEQNSRRSNSPLPDFAPEQGYDAADLLALYRSDPAYFMAVPPDPGRRLVTKREFIRIFKSGRDRRSRHGFGFIDRSEARASRGHAGYYSFSPRRRVRFIVLDTTAGGSRHPGSYQGNLDHPQFRWFRRTLRRSYRRNQLVIVFSHHAIPNLTARLPDEVAPPCSKVGARNVPGCDGDPRRSTPIHLAANARRLMLRHPNAIAWVAGHSHVNRIDPYIRRNRRRRNRRSGFWSIQTSSVADWPKQNRLFQLFDNRDGTLSLFGTLIDHAAPVEVPPWGTNAAQMTPDQLAAIGRTLGYNDTQTGGRACRSGRCRRSLIKGRGERRRDRNVELLIRDPRRQRRGR